MDKKITTSAFGVSISTLISRILGYIRDMFIANYFGAGMLTDAFFVAYRIPNLLRRLLGEGSLSASFVPVFSEYLHTRKREDSKKLVEATTIVLIFIVSLLTILGIVFAPTIVRIIAPGFLGDSNKFRLTVTLTRIMFPFLALIALSALAMGILNSLHKFIVPALAPCWFNISIIISVLFIAPLMDVPVMSLAIGVVIGGFLQLLFQIPQVFKSGFGLSFLKSIFKKCTSSFSHPGLRRIVYLMMPAMLGLSINQINNFVDTICATLLREGSVSALYYSNRLVQLPLALFGTAFSTVILPVMSRSFVEDKKNELKDILSLGLRMMFFTILPASIGLIILGKPIIELLFERGAFSPESTLLTYWALIFYSIGLVAYAGTKIFASAFYALQNTRTPVKIATLSMVVNTILNLLVVFHPYLRVKLHIGGLAFATALSSFLNIILLFIALRRRIGGIGGRRILNSFIKISFSSIIMGLACWYIMHYISYSVKIMQVLISVLVGVGVYIISSYIVGSEEIRHIKEMFTTHR